jgi:hypothetical protein
MLRILYLAAHLFAAPMILFAAPEREPKATSPEVLSWMAEIPACESEKRGCERAGRWNKIGIAPEIAQAIASVAPTRSAASLMTVYEVWEGGNARCAEGDGGRSLGPFQLQDRAREIACDPMSAARVWLRMAEYSWKTCEKKGLPPDERLAQLASGSCDRAREKVRKRAELARRIAHIDPGEIELAE